MLISPLSIRSMPARHRSIVVLPQPDGPSSTTNVPGSTSRDTDRSAGSELPGYVLDRPLTVMGSATGRSSDPAPAGGGEQAVGAEHDGDDGERDEHAEYGLRHADAEMVVGQVVLDGDRRGRRSRRVQQLGQRQ